MNRKTSEYTLRFEPGMSSVPGVIDRVLAHTISRCPATVTGSGVQDGVPFLRFRVEDDTEAARIAAKLTIIDRGPSAGRDRFMSAELSTGQGVHRRVVPIS